MPEFKSFHELKEYRITDIAEILNNKRIPLNSQEREKRNGKYPYFGASGIVDYIDEFIFDGEHVLISEDGENLRSRSTPIAFKVGGRFWVNNHAHIIKGKDPFLNDWIVYYFKNLDINPYITGAVQPKLNKDNLLKIPIYIPDFKIARKIAIILSTLDDKIELNNAINKNLEELAQTLFKRWFVDFNFPMTAEYAASIGKPELAGHPYKDNGGEMVESELGMIPKGWEVGRLKDEFILNMGQSPSGDTYNAHGDGMIFFQGRSDFGFRFPENRMYTNDPKKIAYKFETLISVRAPVGDLNMASENCCIGRGLGAISHPDKLFSYTYYKIKSLQTELKSYDNEGTVFGSINKDTLGNIKIVLPSEEIQTKFNTKISPIDEAIFINSTELKELAELRDTLLPKLISGKLEILEND